MESCTISCIFPLWDRKPKKWWDGKTTSLAWRKQTFFVLAPAKNIHLVLSQPMQQYRRRRKRNMGLGPSFLINIVSALIKMLTMTVKLLSRLMTLSCIFSISSFCERHICGELIKLCLCKHPSRHFVTNYYAHLSTKWWLEFLYCHWPKITENSCSQSVEEILRCYSKDRNPHHNRQIKFITDQLNSGQWSQIPLYDTFIEAHCIHTSFLLYSLLGRLLISRYLLAGVDFCLPVCSSNARTRVR